MFAGMTSGMSSGSAAALFVHQIVPHHANAVDMAKSLIKSDVLECDDLTDEESDGCVMETISRSIINGQNYQIQLMQKYDEAMGLPKSHDCTVKVTSEVVGTEKNSNYEPSAVEAPTSIVLDSEKTQIEYVPAAVETASTSIAITTSISFKSTWMASILLLLFVWI